MTNSNKISWYIRAQCKACPSRERVQNLKSEVCREIHESKLMEAATGITHNSLQNNRKIQTPKMIATKGL